MTLLTLFFDIVLAIINGLLSLLPTLAFPSAFIDSMDWFIEFMTPAGYIIDLKTFIDCAIVIFIMYNIGLVFEIFGWFVNFIPFLRKRE